MTGHHDHAAPRSFGWRLQEAVATRGPLCVGIDPHPGLLRAWGLDDDVRGLRRFSMTCVEAFAGSVSLVKPQSALYERFGARGVLVLEETLEALRQSGTLSLIDVKRGDIGSTMEAYAQAYLGEDSPLRADAMTASPYLGYESLRPALDLAMACGRGVFVLTLTSNPEGRQVQHAIREGVSVAASMVAGVRADNERAIRWYGDDDAADGPPGLSGRGRVEDGQAGSADLSQSGSLACSPEPREGVPDDVVPWGPVGMVVGATVGAAIADLELDLIGANAPLLAPGLGAQGAAVDDVRRSFGPAMARVIAASSRDVLNAGPASIRLRARAVEVADGLRDTLSA